MRASLPDVPADWISGVGQLKYTGALPGWTDAEWRVFQGDANAFLSTWAAQAHGLGWSTLDLFGCHQLAPRARYDVQGLLLFLGGKSIVAMDEHIARIGVRQGRTLSFSRQLHRNYGVPVWS